MDSESTREAGRKLHEDWERYGRPNSLTLEEYAASRLRLCEAEAEMARDDMNRMRQGVLERSQRIQQLKAKVTVMARSFVSQEHAHISAMLSGIIADLETL